MPVIVQLPPRYTAATEWPLMFAMHGGPPGQPAQARSGAERMIRVWKEAAANAGWIVAAPAMIPSVTVGARTEERLPYEIFHPEQAQAVVAALRERFRINPDRIVSTGISLGSNYSIAFAAGEPGWLSAIVPVSTEGDSREQLARNLHATPVYVLEGTGDRNIRMIDGPRRLAEIQRIRLRHHLPGVRRSRPRRLPGALRRRAALARRKTAADVRARGRARASSRHRAGVAPRAVGRVGYAPGARARRRHRARPHRNHGAMGAQDHALPARSPRRLDKPVTVTVNGTEAFKGVVSRSALTALEEVKRWGDERRLYAAKLTVEVPNNASANAAAERSYAISRVKRPEGTLSFWEMYATRALEERLPDAGFEATEVALPRPSRGRRIR